MEVIRDLHRMQLILERIQCNQYNLDHGLQLIYLFGLASTKWYWFFAKMFFRQIWAFINIKWLKMFLLTQDLDYRHHLKTTQNQEKKKKHKIARASFIGHAYTNTQSKTKMMYDAWWFALLSTSAEAAARERQYNYTNMVWLKRWFIGFYYLVMRLRTHLMFRRCSIAFRLMRRPPNASYITFFDAVCCHRIVHLSIGSLLYRLFCHNIYFL